MEGQWCKVDHDKEEEPWYAIFGTMVAALEVQRAIKRTELWALTMARAGHGLSTIHTESMGTIDGLWRGNKCDEKEWDLDVKHVEAHGTEKEKRRRNKALWCKAIEKADALAKEGSDADGGQMAAAKALTIKQWRKHLHGSLADAGGNYQCMRCGKRNKRARNVPWLKWMERLQRMFSKHGAADALDTIISDDWRS